MLPGAPFCRMFTVERRPLNIAPGKEESILESTGDLLIAVAQAYILLIRQIRPRALRNLHESLRTSSCVFRYVDPPSGTGCSFRP